MEHWVPPRWEHRHCEGRICRGFLGNQTLHTSHTTRSASIVESCPSNSLYIGPLFRSANGFDVHVDGIHIWDQTCIHIVQDLRTDGMTQRLFKATCGRDAMSATI